MQTATCIFAGIGAIAGLGAFAVSLKTALELKKAKTQVDHEISKVSAKVDHNKRVVKRALSELQF